MSAEIHAPSYLRNQTDTQLHLIADMIDAQCERIQNLFKELAAKDEVIRELASKLNQAVAIIKNYREASGDYCYSDPVVEKHLEQPLVEHKSIIEAAKKAKG